MSEGPGTRPGVLIPMRLSSHRLPKKGLLEICGRPVLEHLVDRIRCARIPEVIVLCTTTDPFDDELARAAERLGIAVFRGSVQDVLVRLRDAAMHYGIDPIVEVDGDDLLCDPEFIDRSLERIMASGADYVTFQGLPLGVAPRAVRLEAIQAACRDKPTDDTSTGPFLLLTQNPRYRVETISVEPHPGPGGRLRLTLDYPEDFALFREIFTRLYRPDHVFSLKEVLALADSEPQLLAINGHLDAQYWARFHAKTRGTTAHLSGG